MRALKREFIFTVLREPKARLISRFTYQSTRAHRAAVVAHKRNVPGIADPTFVDTLKIVHRDVMFAQLVGDFIGRQRLYAARLDRARIEDQEIERALRRFDFIGLGSMDEVAEGLSHRLQLGGLNIRQENESNACIEYQVGCSEDEFASLLEAHTRLDDRVYRIAHQLSGRPLSSISTEATIAKAKSRFNLSFVPG